jgi:agarase
VRSADPHHIVFGCRFAYVPPAPVVAAAAKHLDAISFNCYDTDPRRAIDAYSVFGKPLVIGEFAFRGDDSGLPNTRGAGPRVKTQADRAAAFTRYATWALSKPNLVGLSTPTSQRKAVSTAKTPITVSSISATSRTRR